MPRKTKTTKRKPQKRKSPEFEGIKSMERTMEATTQMVGNVAIAGMGVALAGSVIGGLGK
jgi:hypothetical protein